MKLNIFISVKLLLFIATLFFITPSSGQSNSVDSILQVAATSKNDTVQIDAYREAAIEIIESNTDSSIIICQVSLQKAIVRNDQQRIGLAYKTIGVAYDIKGDLDSSLLFLNKALTVFINLRRKDWQSHVLSDIAIAYYYRGNYELALRNNISALDLRRKINDKSFIAKSLNNIGALYRARKDYKNAINVYLESLSIKIELKDEQGRLNTMMNIGALYQNDKKYDSALHYARQSLIISELLGAKQDISASKGNIGAALLNLNRSEEALRYLSEADKENTGNSFTANHYTVYEAIGELYLNREEFSLAESYFLKGLKLSKQKQRKESEKIFAQKLSALYAAMGKYQAALQYQLESDKIDDELLNQENVRQLNELTQVYQTAEKEKEIIALNIKGETDKKIILNRKRERNYFIVAAGIFLAMAFFAWKAFISNKRKKEKLDEQNKVIQRALGDNEVLMKEIHHRVKNNLQVISSLLDLQSLTIADTQASEAVKEGKNRVQSMALIHQNLYNEGNIKGIRTKEYISNLLQSLCDSYNITNDKVRVKTEIDDLNLDVDTMIPLGLVLNELVSNSLKYAFTKGRQGELSIVLREEANNLLLKVSDNGTGYPEGMNARDGKSFGMKMIRAFAQKLKAKLDIYNDSGAVVEMHITKYNLA